MISELITLISYHYIVNLKKDRGGNIMAYATLAGGCFWCMVKPFTSYPGIEDVVSGYSGGNIENPTYEQVCSNQTGHREAVQITYNPDITSFENILDVYFKLFDPTDNKGQFLIEAKAMNQQYFIMMNNKKKLLN